MQTCRYGKAFGSELLRNSKRPSVVLLSLRQVAALISNETKAVQGSRKTEALAADRAGLFRLLLIIAICTSPIASFVERIRPSLQEKRENPRPGIGRSLYCLPIGLITLFPIRGLRQRIGNVK